MEPAPLHSGRTLVVPWCREPINACSRLISGHWRLLPPPRREALQTATAEYTSLTAALWQRVLDAISKGPAGDADELRGARPLAALRVYQSFPNPDPNPHHRTLALAPALTLPPCRVKAYHALLGGDEARQVIDEFSDSRSAAVANSEALRKLVKKYDKVP